MDARELANRLGSRGAAKECPACGEDLEVIGQSGYALEALTDGGNIDRTQALKLAALVCSNCGCVRLHALRALSDE
jgi:predicted RNA-binding Zn-ribbon protein involved in translation (DUF1610 family)